MQTEEWLCKRLKMGHYVDAISLAGSEASGGMTDISGLPFSHQIQGMEAHMNSILQGFQEFDKLYRAGEVAYEQASKLVRQRVSEMVKSLKKQEEKVLNELWLQYEKDSTALKGAHKEMGEKITDLQDMITDVQKLDISDVTQDENFWDNSAKVARIMPAICEQLDSLQTELPRVLWQHRSIIRFIPEPQCMPTLGYFQKCFISDDFNRVTKYRICSLRANSIEEKPKVNLRRAKSELVLSGKHKLKRKAPSVPKLHPTPLFKVSNHGVDPGCLVRPMGVSFKSNGNVIVAELGNQRLQEFDLEGTSVRCFKANSSKFKPCSVTMTRDDYVAALDNSERSIKVFTRGGQQMCTFGKGYFKEPLTLACNSKDHYILVDSCGPWQYYVISYDPMAGITKRIGYNRDQNYVLSHPEHITIDQKDNIIISDCGNHCIWIFGPDGRLIRKFGEQGDEDGQLSYPKGISMDRQGNILIADCANHRISMFSMEGKFLRHLLKKEDGLSYPTSLAVSSMPTPSLAVVQNSELLVFEM